MRNASAETESGESYTARKLRGAAIMYGPSLILDLFEGAGVLAVASGVLPRLGGSRSGRTLRLLATAGALSPWAYLLFVRPWQLRWNSTDEEARMSLPGDELVPHPSLESTRAVAIRAPAGDVWPWLVQLGQDRGGFYSYDQLENLAGAEIHNADQIIPEMQHLEVGDFVPMAPVEWNVPMGGFTVVGIDPGRAVVWRQGWPGDVENLGPTESKSRATWAFVLEKVDEETTRLILRERSGRGPRMRDVIFNYLLIERQHFVMVRRMLLGIKERAERTHRQKSEDAATDRTLLDDVMPDYEFCGRQTIHVDAPAGRTVRAFEELTIAEASPPPVKALLSLRYLPARLSGKGSGGQVANDGQRFVEAIASAGNLVLAEELDRELVIGMIGRLHNMLDQHPVPLSNAEEFARFDDPNYQKLAMSVRVEDAANDGCELVFEQRTHALSPASRMKFALYWWLMIKAGSAVMVRMLLRAIKRRAEDSPL